MTVGACHSTRTPTPAMAHAGLPVAWRIGNGKGEKWPEIDERKAGLDNDEEPFARPPRSRELDDGRVVGHSREKAAASEYQKVWSVAKSTTLPGKHARERCWGSCGPRPAGPRAGRGAARLPCPRCYDGAGEGWDEEGGKEQAGAAEEEMMEEEVRERVTVVAEKEEVPADGVGCTRGTPWCREWAWSRW